MNKNASLLSCISVIVSGSALAAANFTISPKVGTTLPSSVSQGASVSAYYTVTNNTSSMRSGYFVEGLPSTVTQNISGMGNCASPITLAAKASCTLQLVITAPVQSNFSLCRGNSCTTASVALNVSSSSISPLVAVGAYENTSSRPSPVIVTSLDNAASWSYTLTDLNPTYPPSFRAPNKHLVSRALRTISASANCVGSSCIAVGGVSTPLVATSSDNGLTWNYTVTPTIPTLPSSFRNGRFASSACISSTCIAAGFYSDDTTDYPLVATSNDKGLTWSYTVSAASPTLPGLYNDTDGLLGASCNSSACIAVGNYYTNTVSYPLIATGTNNATTWSYTVTGSLNLSDYSDGGILNASYCTEVICLAGGSYLNNVGGGQTVPLLAINTGQSWSYVTYLSNTANLPGDLTGRAQFSGVTCKNNVCLAAGSYGASAGAYPLLASSDDGGQTWSYVISSTYPVLTGDTMLDGSFNATTCSSSACVAVGFYDNPANAFPLVATSVDGGQTWAYTVTALTPVMTTDTMVSGGFQSVSCHGDICFATGFYANNTAQYPLIATSTDGGVTWAYTLNSVSPALPSDYQDAGSLSGAGTTASSAFLPDSLKCLNK